MIGQYRALLFSGLHKQLSLAFQTMPENETREKLLGLLSSFKEEFPDVWKHYDSFLADRDELGGWPDWCFCPIAAAIAIVPGGGDATTGRTGFQMSPHIRRAHWHTYWTGHRGRQLPVLKCLQPALVNPDHGQ